MPRAPDIKGAIVKRLKTLYTNRERIADQIDQLEKAARAMHVYVPPPKPKPKKQKRGDP